MNVFSLALFPARTGVISLDADEWRPLQTPSSPGKPSLVHEIFICSVYVRPLYINKYCTYFLLVGAEIDAHAVYPARAISFSLHTVYANADQSKKRAARVRCFACRGLAASSNCVFMTFSLQWFSVNEKYDAASIDDSFRCAPVIICSNGVWVFAIDTGMQFIFHKRLVFTLFRINSLSLSLSLSLSSSHVLL